MLSGGRGLVASDARRVSRFELSTPEYAGHGYPLIARPVNSHAGNGLCKIGSTTELEDYLRTQRDEEFYVAPFIDYRSDDGWFRKYRVVVIDGCPFAAHMAISQKWMVHYLNADMLSNEKNRAEEARFMDRFDSDFAIKHGEALREIDRRIGLEYYSMDCAETRDGRLLIFEIDSGAVVHSMDPIEVFPYKAPQMKRVFSAFREMLTSRIARPSSHRAA